MQNHDRPQTGRVQRIVAAALTVLFLAGVTGFGAAAVLSDPQGVLNSVRFHKAKSFLADPEDTGFFSMTQARIASLQSKLGDLLPLENEMNTINASFQYALGKDMVVRGADQMLRLPNDQLYYLTTRDSLADEARDVVEFYNYLDGRYPFLCAYVTPGFFNGGMELPAGYDVIDTGDELADEVVSVLRDAGIDTLDSRTFFEGTGLTNDDLMFKTDRHWNFRATLLASQTFAREINRLTGANLDLSKLQLDQFETQVLEESFFGDFGLLVGQPNSVVEDVTLYLPKYETDLTRYSLHRTGKEENPSGDFRDVVVRWDTLEPKEYAISRNSHAAYGLIEAMEVIENNGECEDITILVLRDSYSQPICRYLSLVAKRVVSADLRYRDKGALDLIEQYQPDIVVVSYSRFMLEDHGYDFGLDEA